MDDPKFRRALRRHHRERMIEHARAVIRRWSKFDLDQVGLEAARLHDHLAACSCWMCGNPRKFLGERTRQEIRVAWPTHRGGRQRVEDRD